MKELSFVWSKPVCFCLKNLGIKSYVIEPPSPATHTHSRKFSENSLRFPVMASLRSPRVSWTRINVVWLAARARKEERFPQVTPLLGVLLACLTLLHRSVQVLCPASTVKIWGSTTLNQGSDMVKQSAIWMLLFHRHFIVASILILDLIWNTEERPHAVISSSS